MKKVQSFVLFLAAFFAVISLPKSALADAKADAANLERLRAQAEQQRFRENKRATEAIESLNECRASNATLATERDAAVKNCPPPKAPAAKGGPAAPAPKPVCAYDSTLVNGECTCSPVALAVHWPGDQPGVVVRVQRDSVVKGEHVVNVQRQAVVQKKLENGAAVYACVATRDSETALYDEMLRLFKAECSMEPTKADIGAPPDDSAKRYPTAVNDGELTPQTRQCVDLKAYLDSLLRWKRDLENAGPDQNGQPAPFTVANWLLVWNRTLQLADAVADHETRLRKVELTYCHQDPSTHKWIDCPDDRQNRVDVDFMAGIRAGYEWREKSTDSGFLAFDAMFTLWKGNDGGYVGGTGGWVQNPEQHRFIADMRLGYAYGGLCGMKRGEHVCTLRLGGVAHSEPILRYTNDVFGIMGEVGFDWRPSGGIFTLGGSLQVGGDRAAFYPPGRRVIGGTELTIVPTVFVGLNPM